MTDFSQHKTIEKGLRCVALCFGMLRVISCNFEADISSHRHSTTQYLKKSDVRDFLSLLFDTTTARLSSGHHDQLLDVFYGTLIACMIRSLLFTAYRYSTYNYDPIDSQTNHDKTFLDGPRCQLYHPMLLLLGSSMSTFQEDNEHSWRAAEAVHSITCGSSSSCPLDSISMHEYALCFISQFSQYKPPSLD